MSPDIPKLIQSCLDVVNYSCTYGQLTKSALYARIHCIRKHYLRGDYSDSYASDALLSIFSDYPPAQERELNRRFRVEKSHDATSDCPFVVRTFRSMDGGLTWRREGFRQFSKIEYAEDYLCHISRIEHDWMRSQRPLGSEGEVTAHAGKPA